MVEHHASGSLTRAHSLAIYEVAVACITKRARVGGRLQRERLLLIAALALGLETGLTLEAVFQLTY